MEKNSQNHEEHFVEIIIEPKRQEEKNNYHLACPECRPCPDYQDCVDDWY